MTKYLAAFAAACVLALAACGVVIRQEIAQAATLKLANRTATEALNRAATQRTEDLATIAAWQASKSATARQNAQAQQGVQKALRADLPWSEADVPAGVQSALSARFGGSNVLAK